MGPVGIWCVIPIRQTNRVGTRLQGKEGETLEKEFETAEWNEVAEEGKEKTEEKEQEQEEEERKWRAGGR